mmetsp:Transcript_4342/g.9367  ORF Transcript_4342/g.9367 Transcript_4342/m.9367 type:complete len:362 (-) Transcript_4342:106-1191(-)
MLPSLLELALGATVNSFESKPFDVASCLNKELASNLLSLLPTDIDVEVTSKFIENDDYWKRACKELVPKASNIREEHGMSHKRMFFELMVHKILLDATSGDKISTENIIEKIKPFADHIHTLRLRSVAHNFPIDAIASNLPNLTKLDLKYRLPLHKSFQRFPGLKNVIELSPFLINVALKDCDINDKDLGILLDGVDCSLLHLDLSHNKITYNGVASMKALLDSSASTLVTLDVSGNKIGNEGATELGKILELNDTLMSLNLRLNNIEDEGGNDLFSSLMKNATLTKINMAANKLGTDSVKAISNLAESHTSIIESIFLTSNQFSEEDLKYLRQYQICCMNMTNTISADEGFGSLASETPC